MDLMQQIDKCGAGPAVVFLHGFPEIWYSWRHQMTAVASAGFRAIAPDFRGYGLSEQPPQPEKTTFRDLVDDLLVMLDTLHIQKEPRRAEKDFGRFDVKTVVKNIYILFSGSELPTATDDQEIMDLVDESTPLPTWFTEEDLQMYASLYEKSGFRTALQVPYRSVNYGEKDYSLKFGGFEDYIKSGTVKNYVPDLEIRFLPQGTHFVQEQYPDEVNQLLITFLIHGILLWFFFKKKAVILSSRKLPVQKHDDSGCLESDDGVVTDSVPVDYVTEPQETSEILKQIVKLDCDKCFFVTQSQEEEENR
ncbi:UNVERIFIED_CONTAM: AB hydrolase superfamily protein YfhM [Sesamum calycinum]|uniref:AB hydrolase superfamily protein YfhM n=1 Tax=Sesamum calycinum TaxID=2727403 RepID=A0AAW2Q3R9_9LAMI